jgi:hypothetical protein
MGAATFFGETSGAASAPAEHAVICTISAAKKLFMRMRPEGPNHEDDALEVLPGTERKSGLNVTLRHHFRVRPDTLT